MATTNATINILLVNAWENNSGEKCFLSPPIGLWRMEAYLRDRFGSDVNIEVFDPNLYTDPKSKLASLFYKTRFHIIGFSPLYLTLENDLALMYYTYEKSPHALFIGGGQEATFNPRLLFDNVPHLDIVVIGEGERPFEGIVNVIKNINLADPQANGSNASSAGSGPDHRIIEAKLDLSRFIEVPGLFLRGVGGPGPGGRTGFNKPLTKEEFTKLTFLTDFSRVPIKEYWDFISGFYPEEQLKTESMKKKIFTIKPFTSNYCPFNCIFCSSTNFLNEAGGCHAKLVALLPDELYEYIKILLKNQPETKTILFKDDNFFVRGNDEQLKNLLLKLVQLKKEHPFLSFSAKARVDFMTQHPEHVQLLKEAGFFSLSFGVESFDQNDLDYIGKKTTPEENIKALKIAKEHDIKAIIYVILSYPVSTIESIFNTINNSIKMIGLGHVVKINPYMVLLPGSRLAKETDLDKLLIMEKFRVPWYNREISRVSGVLPKDANARDLITTYEKSYPEIEQQFKEKLGLKHFVSEINTLVKFLTLYKIAEQKGFLSREECERKMEELKAMIIDYTSKYSKKELEKDALKEVDIE